MKLLISFILILSQSVYAEFLSVTDVNMPRFYELIYDADKVVKSIDKETLIKSFGEADLLTISASEIEKFGSFNDHFGQLFINYRIPYPKGKPKVHYLIQKNKAYLIYSNEIAVQLSVNYHNDSKTFYDGEIGSERYNVTASTVGFVDYPIEDGGVIISSSEWLTESKRKLPLWRGSLSDAESSFRTVSITSKDKVHTLEILENSIVVASHKPNVLSPEIMTTNYWELPNGDMLLIVSMKGNDIYEGSCESVDTVFKVDKKAASSTYEMILESCQGYVGFH